MKFKNLKNILEKKSVFLNIVKNQKELSKKQDSVLLDNDCNILGLSLKNVDLSDIYEELFSISTIKYLIIKNVNIKEFKHFNIRGLLKTLDLSGNDLKELPKEIRTLTSLQSLNLGDNDLKELPKEIRALTSLQSLNLSLNGLKELPKEIVALTSLQSLDLSFNGLKELPKEIVALTSLQSLNLSDNDLKELPKEIRTLTSLQSLNLSLNDLKELPKEIVALTSLQSLNLSNNGLKELPKEIRTLTSLQSLDLRGNGLKELPKEIRTLTSLQSLDLRGNGLKELPKEIRTLTSLQSLNLSLNGLKELPKEIRTLTSLQSLDLSDNDLKELPKEIRTLTSLQSLDLSLNDLKELPKEIRTLTSLQSLDLSGNDLKELPKEIRTLTSLQSLDLSLNDLKELPKEILALTSLQSLDLGDNDLKELPKEIRTLTSLQSLDLSDNGLKVPKEIRALTSLQSLDLSGNGLKELPKEIMALTSLQSLNLSLNDLKVPKEIVALTSLQSLDLGDNDLKELPKEIMALTSLQSLDLGDNDLKELPKEIVSLKRLTNINLKNNPKIKIDKKIVSLKVLKYLSLDEKNLKEPYKSSYKRGLENLIILLKNENIGFVELFETKALFVGEPSAGKTSLMEKILNKNYKLKNPQDSESTLGIDIKTCNDKFKKNNKTISMSMWDFGGQQIQYMTHQFFLTANSLYILVGDDRKQNTDFDYWFHIINLLSNNSPILVVLNERKGAKITNFAQKKYLERFSSHKIKVQDISLDNIEDGRYEKLINNISLLLNDMSSIPRKAPASWINIKKKINELAKNKKVIPYKEFKEICLKEENVKEEDISVISNYFHDIGLFLHYFDDMNDLKDIIFLDPEWLMQGIYSVLKDESVKENNGVFTKQWIFDFWSKHSNKYDESIQTKLLQLMLKDKFEICYKIDENKFMAPQLLNAEYDNLDFFDLGNKVIHYRYVYPFMPKGIITRLIVRMNDLIFKHGTNQVVWSEGVVLQYHRAKAKIEQTKDKNGVNIIDIIIIENHQSGVELFYKIKNELENIHKKSFENITFNEMVSCGCSECENSEEAHFFDLKNIETAISKLKQTINCPLSSEDVDIEKLLHSIFNKFLLNDKNDKRQNEAEFYKKELDKTRKLFFQIKENKNKTEVNVNVNVKIRMQINQMSSDLNSMKQRIKNEKLTNAINTKDLEDIINNLENKLDVKEIKNNGTLSDLKDFYEDSCEKIKGIENIINTGKKTIRSLQSIAKTYNEIADYLALPHVPKILL